MPENPTGRETASFVSILKNVLEKSQKYKISKNLHFVFRLYKVHAKTRSKYFNYR